jgi:hypothetical protein
MIAALSKVIALGKTRPGTNDTCLTELEASWSPYRILTSVFGRQVGEKTIGECGSVFEGQQRRLLEGVLFRPVLGVGRGSLGGGWSRKGKMWGLVGLKKPPEQESEAEDD